MTRESRPIAWMKAARKAFEDFPAQAQNHMRFALTIAAESGKSGIAKPLHGLGSGVFEIALAHHGDAFRVVYLVQIDEALWVVHAFQKKSTRGIKTPRHEIGLIADRIERLKRMLKEH